MVVLERESAPALGSTGKSAAGVRVQFTKAANVALSMYSLPVYRNFLETHGHEIGYRDIGYLLLVPEERWNQHLKAVALQKSLGAPVELLSPEDACRYLPIATDGLAGATYGPWDGIIDPHLATQALVTMSREVGATYHFNQTIGEIKKEGTSWRVRVDDNSFSCGYFVNAAGAWSGVIGAKAGLQVPVQPKKIQIFLSGPIADKRVYPLTIDLGTGVYLRGEGDRILFGLDSHASDEGFTEGIDWGWLEHVLLTGVARYPWWEDLGVDRRGSWWGYYEVTPDNSPVIGFNPGTERWVDACGFSGHGIMHAPATGLAVSELVADGHSHTLALDAFRHDRFAGDNEAPEVNIF